MWIRMMGLMKALPTSSMMDPGMAKGYMRDLQRDLPCTVHGNIYDSGLCSSAAGSDCIRSCSMEMGIGSSKYGTFLM